MKVKVVFCLLIFTVSVYANNSAKKTALEFVSAVYIESNIKKALQFFDKDAKTKSNFREGETFKVSLGSIIFFHKKDIETVKKRVNINVAKKFSRLKNNNNRMLERVSKHIKNNLGCLVIFYTKQEKNLPIINVYVFAKKKNTYKIAYQDDN